MPEAVVVTRPLPQAQEFASRLRAAGRETIIFPLLDIQPLDDHAQLDAALAQLERYALIAFVSPNAIDAAFRQRTEWPRGLTIGVVGEGSRKALARHGMTPDHATIISPNDPEHSDSEGLLAQLDMDSLRGQRALIVRGEQGRELLTSALRAAGVEVEQVAAYRRVAPQLDSERAATLDRLLDGDAIWVITSSEALRNLVAMSRSLTRPDSEARLLQRQLLVPHARIAETAGQLGFTRIDRCASGDELMLAKLQLR